MYQYIRVHVRRSFFEILPFFTVHCPLRLLRTYTYAFFFDYCQSVVLFSNNLLICLMKF